MSTLKAALPDWFGQKYLTQCLKYENGMGLTWELINPRNFDFYAPLLHIPLQTYEFVNLVKSLTLEN